MRAQHYRFAHQVLMDAVTRNPEAWWGGAETHGVAMIQQAWAAAATALSPPDLVDGPAPTLEPRQIAPGAQAWLVTMPPPREPAECHFAAILKVGNEPPRYFVCELGAPSETGAPRCYWAEWRLAPGGGVMRIRGRDLPDATAETFLAAAAQEIAATPGATSGAMGALPPQVERHFTGQRGGMRPFGAPPKKKSRAGLVIGLAAVGFFVLALIAAGFLWYFEEMKGIHPIDVEAFSAPVEPDKPFAIEFSWTGFGYAFNNIWLVVEDGQKKDGQFKIKGKISCGDYDTGKDISETEILDERRQKVEDKGGGKFSAWFYLADEYHHGSSRVIRCTGVLHPEAGTFTKAHIAVTQRQRPSDFIAR
jgi:hypothetical protein